MLSFQEESTNSASFLEQSVAPNKSGKSLASLFGEQKVNEDDTKVDDSGLTSLSLSPEKGRAAKRRKLSSTKERLIFFPEKGKMMDLVRLALEKVPNTKLTHNTRKYKDCVVSMAVNKARLPKVMAATNNDHRADKFPGTGPITSKLVTVLGLRHAAQWYPECFDYMPRSWILPQDMNSLTEYWNANKKQIFIVKPTHGSGGEGIFLSHSLRDLKDKMAKASNKRGWVVQHYVDNPMLLNGYKFDLRLYVLVTSLNPLKVHICREGLVRCATKKYNRPTKNSMDLFSHLTNFTINKENPDFVDAFDGSKQSLSAFMNDLKRGGVNTDDLWAQFEHIADSSMQAMAPLLQVIGNDFGHANVNTGKCYHIFGYDILVDQDFKAHLIEINSRPAMDIRTATAHANGAERIQSGVDNKSLDLTHFSPVDMAVKVPMLAGSLYKVLEGSKNPVPMADRDAHCDCFKTIELRNLPLFKELYNRYTKVIGSKPPTGFTMRRFLRPYVKSLGKHVEERDIGAIWNVYRMKNHHVSVGKIDPSLEKYFNFVRFVETFVSKACPNEPMNEGMDRLCEMMTIGQVYKGFRLSGGNDI